MPRWKPRDPSIYPILYSETVLAASRSSSPVHLSSHSDAYSAQMAADRFREWRFCLRSNGTSLHRAFELERDFRITLRTDVQAGVWSLSVEVKPKRLSSLERLNPSLKDILHA